jgi:hypothetical protein
MLISYHWIIPVEKVWYGKYRRLKKEGIERR